MKRVGILTVLVVAWATAAESQDGRRVEIEQERAVKVALERLATKLKVVQAETEKLRAQTDAGRGFSVILAVGDIQGTTAVRNLPEAASKALADMSQFLPYKSYELLDAQWILGSPRSIGLLRGPENREYHLELSTVPRGDNAVQIDFNLRDSRQPFTTVYTPGREVAASRPAGVRVLKQSGRVIDTTFTMDVGETVVVGTSRLQGDKALIVLLTAVGK